MKEPTDKDKSLVICDVCKSIDCANQNSKQHNQIRKEREEKRRRCLNKRKKIKWFRWHVYCIYQTIRSKTIKRLPKPLQDAYLAYKQSNRTGECLRCGNCCMWNVTKGYCNHFNPRNHKCRINGTKGMVCRMFPIDDMDMFITNCKGYKFKKKI